ncbi:MAG: hypothetical protein ACTS2F_25285 [Thainema sp.]
MKAVEFLGVGIGSALYLCFRRCLNTKNTLINIVLFSTLNPLSFIILDSSNLGYSFASFFISGITQIIVFLGISNLFAEANLNGIEGTAYALFVSVLNFVFSVGFILGSYLYDQGTHFNFLVEISSISTLLFGILALILRPLDSFEA